MNQNKQQETNCLFTTNQIICLEYKTTCLYGEVIQLIPRRRMCWFRPIYMTKGSTTEDCSPEVIPFLELESADLLWPISLFRPAWDTEVIDLLTKLGDRQKSEEIQQSSSKYLQQFVTEVWTANQDKFV